MARLTVEALRGTTVPASGSMSLAYLTASVTDDTGKPVKGLKKNQLTLTVLGHPVDGPVQIAVESIAAHAGYEHVGIKPGTVWEKGIYTFGLAVNRSRGRVSLHPAPGRRLPKSDNGQTVVSFTVA